MDDEIQVTIAKSIRFPAELHDKIQQIAKDSDRDFTKQVLFMCKEYLRIKEGK